MKKIYRVLFYSGGMLLQCLGLTLGTKTNFGASAIISLPFTIGEVTGINFAVFNFLLYLVMIAIQFLLHRKFHITLLLQIPVALVISALIGVFDALIPIPSALWTRILCMALAILGNGIGGAMMVDMKVIPNVADGLANVLGERLGKNLGFGKNILDFTCVGLSCIISLLCKGRLVGVGIGTVFAMIFVGRVMAVFNHLFRRRITEMAGISL